MSDVSGVLLSVAAGLPTVRYSARQLPALHGSAKRTRCDCVSDPCVSRVRVDQGQPAAAAVPQGLVVVRSLVEKEHVWPHLLVQLEL